MRQYMTLLKSYSDSSVGLVPPVAQALYFRLFLINNRAGWTEWFGATNQRLMLEVGLNSAHTLIENRNLLKRLGFIDFKQGKKGQPTLYRLNDMCEEEGALNALNTAPQTALETASNSALNTAPQTAHIYRQETMTKTKKEKCKKENTLDSLLESCLESYTDNAELLEALRGFVEMRREKGRSLTKRALRLNLSKLDKLSSTDEEKIAIVNETVMRGWLGFFPLKQEVRQHGTGRDNRRAALEERYPDFAEADRDYIPPWKLRPPGGGDQAASG
ncbi:hypothetical protein [Selenomonas dianae]|uniref:Uncharacterized protein n=1 Tax=Selenomonas dianae TaxID=135079 RepID=A0ABN0T8H4_9FIRM|nr:hypothetical protein [Selenomonas dianae]WLD81437.1 hypothetical protein QU667_06190 [Selenomonas dianae]